MELTDQDKQDIVAALQERKSVASSADLKRVRTHLLAGCRNESERQGVMHATDEDMRSWAESASVKVLENKELAASSLTFTRDSVDQDAVIVSANESAGERVQKLNGRWW